MILVRGQQCPTGDAMQKLAARFNLPYGPEYPHMQDWEHEVADRRRIDEFLLAYETEELL